MTRMRIDALECLAARPQIAVSTLAIVVFPESKLLSYVDDTLLYLTGPLKVQLQELFRHDRLAIESKI